MSYTHIRATVLQAVASSSVLFFPATGKSRRGALDSLGPELAELLADQPGVFIQGLYCVDRDGKVVFERKLSVEAVQAAEKMVRRENDSYHGPPPSSSPLCLVGYDGDVLYTNDPSADMVRILHQTYGEVLAQPLPGSLTKLSQWPAGFHKLLIMDRDPERLARTVRPQLETLSTRSGDETVVTQAIPTMLELLPAGGGKCEGVRALCEKLGINVETELLALGDAENDADLLRRAAIGVAVGNGCDRAKAAADYVLTERDHEGAAGKAMEMFGFRSNLGVIT